MMDERQRPTRSAFPAWLMVAIAALMMWCGSCRFAAAAPPWGDEIVPIAQISGGHSSVDAKTNYVSHKSYRALADEYGPLLKHFGYRRVYFKNPGGAWRYGIGDDAIMDRNAGDKRSMWFHQWRWAKAKGLAFAQDCDLIYFTQKLAANGVEEIIVYVGTPETAVDPVADAKTDLAFVRLMAAAAPPGCRVTVGFDALSGVGLLRKNAGQRTPGNLILLGRVMQLIDELQAEGIAVYMESRPPVGDEDLWSHLEGSFALAATDFGIQKAHLPKAHLCGEVIRITTNMVVEVDAETKTWNDLVGGKPVTPVVRRWTTQPADSILSPAMKDWNAKQAKAVK